MVSIRKLNNLLSKGATSIGDLQKLCDMVGLNTKFIGSMFDLPKSLTNGKYIAMIHPNPGVSSGHWVAIDVKPNRLEYYDSYGMPTPSRITRDTKKPIFYNSSQIQAMNHSHCGLYAIYFLINGNIGMERFRVINEY